MNMNIFVRKYLNIRIFAIHCFTCWTKLSNLKQNKNKNESPGTMVGQSSRNLMIENKCRLNFSFLHISSSWVKIGWHTEISFLGPPEVGEKQSREKKERRKKKIKVCG